MGLIARNVEEAGISTLCMASVLDVMKAVNPPRVAFLDYPLGHTAGPSHQPNLQRRIIVEALEAFTSLTEPGQIKNLPFKWPDGTSWEDEVLSGEDLRLDRYDSPQYQNEEDRRRAEGGHH